jgi:1,4-alpha-glucan branching enzyme
MYEKGSKKGTVRFVMKPAQSAKKVVLVGDFSKWEPIVMRKQTDGRFSATVSLGAGTHEYKFIVDGEWVVDPDNNTWALNPYGTLNSVAHAE